MAVIYKATNTINGKAYIGIDSNWPHRKHAHLFAARNSKAEAYAFHRAIRKYGEQNFRWEVLLENATPQDEIRLIEEHGTFRDTGYNLTKGGEATMGWIPSEETRRKISEANKGNKNCVGRVMSEETRKRISESKKGKPSARKGQSSPLKGRKQSDELIAKRVASRKGYRHSEETKAKLSAARRKSDQ